MAQGGARTRQVDADNQHSPQRGLERKLVPLFLCLRSLLEYDECNDHILENINIMASVGDVLRIRGCQSLLGETLCNVFYYVVAVWTGNLDLDDVLDEFVTEVIGPLTADQTTDLTWTDLNIDNLNDPDEFVERPVEWPGTTEDNVMPAYVAVGVQLVRTTKQTRHGAKRFAGYGESNWTDGVFDMPGVTVQRIVAACESALDIDPGGGNQITCDPVIVGTDPLTGKPDPGRINAIKQAVVRRDTTQNSRKGYTQ